MASYYAVAKAAAVLIPLGSMLRVEELTYKVSHAGARVVIGSHADAGQLRELMALGDLDHAVVGRFRGRPCGGPGRLPEPVQRGIRRASASILGSGGDRLRVRRDRPSERRHAEPSRRGGIGTARCARTAHNRLVSALPLSGVSGSSVTNAAMLAGSMLITQPRFSAAVMLGAIATHRATMIDGVPSTFDDLLAHADFDRYDLASLRLCWVGGQILPAARSIEFSRRTGCPVHEVWGMPELAGAASANPISGIHKPGTIGLPYPGNVFRVVHPEEPSRSMPRGPPGELMCQGPLVMMGDYSDPAATAETLRPDGWLDTGNIAVMDDHGYVTMVARKRRDGIHSAD